MRETFKNLKNIASLHQGQREDLDTLTLEYQQTKDNVLLAVVFVELYPYIVTQVGKYFNLTESDKASIALQELDKAMLDFRTGKGAKLKTFYSRYLNRGMYRETNMLNHQKRKANNACASYESSTDQTIEGTGEIKSLTMQYHEERYDEYDLVSAIEVSEILTDNEIKYCKIIMRENNAIKDSEIARELSVSPSAINQMKKALKKKFLKLNICFE